MMSATVQNTVNASNPLRRWRVLHHVTQAQLAADMRVHPSVVSQWEKHHCVPSLERFHELQRHTGIAVHSLLRFFVPLPAVPVTSAAVIQFANALKR